MADVWGAVYVPAQAPPPVSAYPGDPALDYTLAFLFAWLVTDAQASGAWEAAFGYPLVKSGLSLFPYNPAEATFQSSYLPALYLWRDDAKSGSFEYLGDDWLLDKSVWKLLWALPQGDQENARNRTQYANQLAKAVVVGIERGYTPSWVVPGDPDPAAAGGRGSFLGYWTNLVRFSPVGWRRARIRPVMLDGSRATHDFPAVELTFEAIERQDRTIRRYPPLGYLDQRILNRYGRVVDHEIDH